MPIKFRYDLIEKDVRVMFPKTFGPEARSKALAAYARRRLGDADAQNKDALGYTPTHKTFVDRSPSNDASLERVQPDGEIRFEFELVSSIINDIYQLLRESSPVRTGRYRDSHVILLDGHEIEPTTPLPEQFDEVVFVNFEPYARKIERNHKEAYHPAFVYETVARIAHSLYSNAVKISYGYRTVETGAIHEWANKTDMLSPGRRGQNREDWLRAQPAIILERR